MGTRKRPEVAAHVAELRRTTPCAGCGGGPVEWHSDRHIASPGRRVANMVADGYKLDDVLVEIAQCKAVCRLCHMTEDGRIVRLHESSKFQKGVVIVPPRPCVACGREAKPLRRGKCNRCRMRSSRLQAV